MKIAILSDTHNNLHNIQAVRQIILAEEVDAIIHCGDLTGADVLDYFGDFKLCCVHGNGDFAPEVKERLKWLNPENQSGDYLDLKLGSRKIFVTHGHMISRLRKAVESGEYDYVFHGHTHRFKDEKIGNTRLINPGALGGKKVEDRSFAVLDLESGELRRIIEPFKL
jgi:putative phosphoesterase